MPLQFPASLDFRILSLSFAQLGFPFEQLAPPFAQLGLPFAQLRFPFAQLLLYNSLLRSSIPIKKSQPHGETGISMVEILFFDQFKIDWD